MRGTWLVTSNNPSVFNAELNDTIKHQESEGKEIIDVKFSTSSIEDDDVQYSALIIFELPMEIKEVDRKEVKTLG